MNCKVLATAIAFFTFQSAYAVDSKITTGFSMSESILGFSIYNQQHDFNLGIKRFGFNSEGSYVIYPGISYSYNILESNYYASSTLGFAILHNDKYDLSVQEYGYVGDAKMKLSEGFGPAFFAIQMAKKWDLSKRLQINADAGFATPLKGDDALKSWNLVGGLGIGFKI